MAPPVQSMLGIIVAAASLSVAVAAPGSALRGKPAGLAKADDAPGSMSWRLMTNHPGWSSRSSFGFTATSIDELIFTSGDHYGAAQHDTYRAHSNGTAWEQVATSNGMLRRHHAMSLGPIPKHSRTPSLVVTGGVSGVHTSTALKTSMVSTNRGEYWATSDPNAPGPTARFAHVQAYLPARAPDGGWRGATVTCGGYDANYKPLNDCWVLSSSDLNSGWRQVTTTEFPGRGRAAMVRVPASVASPHGPQLVVMGGTTQAPNAFTSLNDVWASTDSGSTWSRLTGSAPWSTRSGHAAVAHPSTGVVYLLGGLHGHTPLNDVWSSADAGQTWTQVTSAAEWAGRFLHGAAIDRWGCIVVAGGQYTTDSQGLLKTDVWAGPAGPCTGYGVAAHE